MLIAFIFFSAIFFAHLCHSLLISFKETALLSLMKIIDYVPGLFHSLCFFRAMEFMTGNTFTPRKNLVNRI